MCRLLHPPRMVKARKDWQCFGCEQTYGKDEPKEVAVHIGDGNRIYTLAICSKCQHAEAAARRDSFDGILWPGGIREYWDEVEDEK